MKRFYLKSILALIIIVIISIPYISRATVQYGDINNDGNINSVDVLLVLRHIHAKSTNNRSDWVLTGNKLSAGDVTQNGTIDTSDLLVMLRYIAAQTDSEIKRKHSDWLNLVKEKSATNEQKTKNNTVKELNVTALTAVCKTKTLQLKSKKGKGTCTTSELVNITPSNAVNKEIIWKVGDTKIASFSNGKLVAKQLGSTTLKGTLKSNSKLTVEIKIIVEQSDEAKAIAKKATNKMIAIANDNSHGYNWDESQKYGQHGEYSCSGLNIAGWEYAGIPVRSKYKANTANSKLPSAYINAGFVDVLKLGLVNVNNKKGLQLGDVLLKTSGSGHTAGYCGNGKLVEARGNFDGRKGDSSGQEIRISNYYNFGIVKVLRYVGN